MLYIEPDGTDAAFHFSAEEFVMQNSFGENVLMIWQAANTAMLGVNQIAAAEINMPEATKESVQIVRRASGGGTIYTDMGSLLYTFIRPFEDSVPPIDVMRKNAAEPIVAALAQLGVCAEISGRNDILVGGKKVSGLAQYVKNGRILTHGSLLYDTDLELLAKLITANPEKFRSKALQSVRSRVCNISEHIPSGKDGAKPTTHKFWGLLKQALFQDKQVKEHTFDADEITAINAIRNEKFANKDWTFGRSPKFTYTNSRRFEGGQLNVYFNVKNGIITDCTFCGDFLGVLPIREFEARLENQDFTPRAVAGAIDDMPISAYLGGISQEEFMTLIFATR